MSRREIIIKDTHRGLWYEDGVLVKVLEAGRYKIPRRWFNIGPLRRPQVEIVRVDVRERDLTIKGQEILTSDKVAIRVSIIVQFRVTDPRAALHEVASYEDRIYTDRGGYEQSWAFAGPCEQLMKSTIHELLQP